MGYTINTQNEAKLLLSWPLSPPRFIGVLVSEAPLDHDGLGLTHHLPEAPVLQPRQKRFEQRDASLVLLSRWQATK